MVDHHRQREGGQQGAEFDYVLGLQMQHQMPAQRRDPRHDPQHQIQLGRAPEMAGEGEPHPAHPALVQPLEIRLGERIVDHGDAAVAAAAAGDGVQHGRIVGAAAARLHDDRALEPEDVLQPAEVLHRRVGRGVGAALRIGESVGRAEDVAMGVAGTGRKLDSGFPGVGVGRLATLHGIPDGDDPAAAAFNPSRR